MINNLKCISCDTNTATMTYEQDSIYMVCCECGYGILLKHASITALQLLKNSIIKY